MAILIIVEKMNRMNTFTLKCKHGNNSKIKAFSLAEMMVVMFIMCLIMIASYPIITKHRQTTQVQPPAPINVYITVPNNDTNQPPTPDPSTSTDTNAIHGEIKYTYASSNTCYINDATTASSCAFTPPGGVTAILLSFSNIGGYEITDKEVTVVPNQAYNLNIGAGSIVVKW